MREIVQSGGRAHGYCCNVAKHENVVELHEKVIVTIQYSFVITSRTVSPR